jgi:RNase H-fold protein (predicted Holliday junction resolvase)
MADMEKVYAIGVDPGSHKCGMAVVTMAGVCVARCVVHVDDFEAVFSQLVREYHPAVAVLGDRTAADEFRRRLEQLTHALDYPIEIHMVSEHLSSEEGRRRYLRAHRKGWRLFVPLGLQWPSEPYDDHVAEVLVLRYLRQGGTLRDP